MNNKIAAMFAAMAVCLSTGLSTAPAVAQNDDIRTERVRFEQGESSTTIASRIKGYKTVDYVLGARAGQVMSVNMTTDNGANYFNILPPGSTNVAMFIGSTSGNSFEGALPESGDYRIRVYMMRSAARRNEVARYSLKVSVSGEQSQTSPGKSDRRVSRRDAAVAACKDELHQSYGIRYRDIRRVSVEHEGRGRFSVSGNVHRYKGAGDTFSCRVAHREVVALKLHSEDNPGRSVGSGSLGAALLGTAIALSEIAAENEPHPAYEDEGSPLLDRAHLKKACRHHIARQLRHNHDQFDSLRLVNTHVDRRTLSGDGVLGWHGSQHSIHFSCHFNRNGRVTDGRYNYHPAQRAAYEPEYADGFTGGPDAYRVTGVAANDVLYVHVGPLAVSRRIGSLPHDARGVRNLGCKWDDMAKATLCHVEYRGLKGWAAQAYLAEDS